MDIKKILKKVWHFIWEEDSFWSWILNIILAFLLIKFIVYPGLGLALGTTYPVVAIVSSSMEHSENFDEWWQLQRNFYENYNISKEQFMDFKYRNGFNKGDIMILRGVKPENVKIGDVLVYKAGRADPIIHRVVNISNYDGIYIFQTKGDNNLYQIKSPWLDETNVPESAIIGKATLRIPFLGWIKIAFVEILRMLGIM